MKKRISAVLFRTTRKPLGSKVEREALQIKTIAREYVRNMLK